ncbi:12873_t:CDS:1, partial [Acaulospora colombiana]
GVVLADAENLFVFAGTFCGVFRRQALDRGAVMLGVDHIVTGHNADDIAETVLMN